MNIRDFLENVHSLCITGHVRPDGDCVGSTLGLYTYIRNNYPEIDVDVYIEEPTEKLKFVANFDKIKWTYPDHAPYDLMICLDAAALGRIGKAEKYFKAARHTVNIDHHISNTMYADENYVEGNSSSACEVLYGFLDEEKIDRDVAIALYTGIIYDTGVFKYRSTSPATMQIAGKLMEYDIPTDEIIDDSFYAKSYEENRIFGYAVMNSKRTCDGKVIYSSLTKKDMTNFHVSSKELEGIVPQLRLTQGVVVAVFAYETPAGDIKVSLRSNDPFDVNEIACKFGGGGHIRAAGLNMQGKIDDCMEIILAEIKKKI